MKFSKSAVTGLQTDVMRIFASLGLGDAFYLAGGTALAAFYLHHRRSRDLDFFTTHMERIPQVGSDFIDALRQAGLQAERRKRLGRAEKFSFEIDVARGGDLTVVQILADTKNRLGHPVESTEFPGLFVDDLRNIAAAKVEALYDRFELRDFIDVYFLLMDGPFSGRELVEMAMRRGAILSGDRLDPYWLNIRINEVYRIKGTEMEFGMLLRPVTTAEMIRAFNSWRDEIRRAFGLELPNDRDPFRGSGGHEGPPIIG